jgi:hypothetical protein
MRHVVNILLVLALLISFAPGGLAMRRRLPLPISYVPAENNHAAIYTVSGTPYTFVRQAGLTNAKAWYYSSTIDARMLWTGTAWAIYSFNGDDSDYTSLIAEGAGNTQYPWQADWSLYNVTVTEGS